MSVPNNPRFGGIAWYVLMDLRPQIQIRINSSVPSYTRRTAAQEGLLAAFDLAVVTMGGCAS